MATPAGFVQASALTQILNDINEDADFLIGITDQATVPKLRIYQILALLASAQLQDITLAAASTALADQGVPKFVRLDPDGSARTVVLPDPTEARQYILLTTDTAFDITVNDGAAATIGTLNAGTQALWVVYDVANTTWIVIPLGGGGGGGGTTEQIAVDGTPLDMATTNDADAVEFVPTADTVVTLTDRSNQRFYNKSTSFKVTIQSAASSGNAVLGDIGGASVHKSLKTDFIDDEHFIFLA